MYKIIPQTENFTEQVNRLTNDGGDSPLVIRMAGQSHQAVTWDHQISPGVTRHLGEFLGQFLEARSAVSVQHPAYT